jgi:hypothetical protein
VLLVLRQDQEEVAGGGGEGGEGGGGERECDAMVRVQRGSGGAGGVVAGGGGVDIVAVVREALGGGEDIVLCGARPGRGSASDVKGGCQEARTSVSSAIAGGGAACVVWYRRRRAIVRLSAGYSEKGGERGGMQRGGLEGPGGSPVLDVAAGYFSKIGDPLQGGVLVGKGGGNAAPNISQFRKHPRLV